MFYDTQYEKFPKACIILASLIVAGTFLQWMAVPIRTQSMLKLEGFNVINFFTHPFMHNNFLFLVWNMFLFYLFIPITYQKFQGYGFFICLAVFSLVAGTTHLILSDQSGAGASGMIYGCAGFSLMTNGKNKLMFTSGDLQIPYKILIIMVLAADLIMGLLDFTDISVFAHQAAAVTGAAAGFLLMNGYSLKIDSMDKALID